MKIFSVLREAGAGGGGAGGGAAGAGGAAGSGTPDWLTGLDDGAKAHITAKGYKTPGDVVKAHIEAERLIGSKRLPAPDQNWKPEQWDALYAELGRPASADKYTLPEVKLPDGLKLDDDVKVVRELAHKMGLNQRQAGMLLEAYMGTSATGYTQQLEAKKQAAADAETALKAKWGDNLDGRRGLVKAVLAKHGSPELAQLLESGDIGNNPDLFNFLVNVGTTVIEDTAGGKHGMTLPPATRAQNEIEQLRTDTQFMAAYGNSNHPNHAAAVARMTRLYSEAFPGTQKFE